MIDNNYINNHILVNDVHTYIHAYIYSRLSTIGVDGDTMKTGAQTTEVVITNKRISLRKKRQIKQI